MSHSHHIVTHSNVFFNWLAISILTFLVAFSNNYTIAQERQISGQVLNVDDQPLVDVLVCNSDSSHKTSTDLGGFFSIKISDNETQLFFSKQGYQTHSEQLTKNNTIQVVLEIRTIYELSFEDLLQTKVKTVSLREQEINKAPGIITILTKEDIRLLGARTVREALTYVPGFSPMQNDDEQIFAVRGIFATTNQKILVMRDGHSLNEANLDLPQTDYSLSIENIEKIEIIRGPGASIYGNSALAAVVNIITTNRNENHIKISAGSYGQRNVDAFISNKNGNSGEFLLFGRYAATVGQPYHVNVNMGASIPEIKGNYRTNNYPDNYDIGAKYKTNWFSTSLNARKHDYQTFWTAQGLYTQPDSLFNSLGLKQNSFHFDFTALPVRKDNFSVQLQNYFDYAQLKNSRLLANIETQRYIHGRIQLNEWNVAKAGINYYGIYSVQNKGEILAGISFENRQYLDSWLASNTLDSSKIEYSKKPFFPKSNENRGAFYTQIQYNIKTWLTVDAGTRYDMAQNYDATFNPRLALLVQPFKPLYFKLIYTKAFQAPGYSYRTSNADYSGSIATLQAEKLTTYQASTRYEFSKNSFIELVGYYNYLSNLITRTDKNYYANQGHVSTYGWEIETKHSFSIFSLSANYSLLLPDTARTDDSFLKRNVSQNEFRHFPKHTANVYCSASLTKYANISFSTQYTSGFHSIGNEFIDSKCIFNSGIYLNNLISNINFSANVYNLMNKKFKLGDPSVLPMLQPGRWILISLIYQINNK